MTTKGNGDAFLSPERHTSLTDGGGQAGQGYPCALIEQQPIVLESNQNHATVTDTVVCPTLSASMGMGGGYVPMIVEGADVYNGMLTGDTAVTLTANSGSTNTAGPRVLVSSCIPIEGNGTRESHHGSGYKESETMFTLNATEQHCVAVIPINTMVATRDTLETRTTFGIGEPDDPQFTLQANHEHGVAIIRAAGFKAGQSKDGGLGFEEEKSPTLSATPSALEPTVLITHEEKQTLNSAK